MCCCYQLHRYRHEVQSRQQWKQMRPVSRVWLPTRQNLTAESVRDRVYKVQHQKPLLLQPVPLRLPALRPVENDHGEFELTLIFMRDVIPRQTDSVIFVSLFRQLSVILLTDVTFCAAVQSFPSCSVSV